MVDYVIEKMAKSLVTISGLRSFSFKSDYLRYALRYKCELFRIAVSSRKSTFLIYRAVIVLPLALALLVLGGCRETGERYYPVSGKITFADGSPAMFGSIESRSNSATPVIARGRIGKDGTFDLRSTGGKAGLVEGTHQLIIIQVIGSPRGGGTVIHNHGHETAAKYRTYETSDLSIKVQPNEDNHFELTVESKPKE